MEAISSNHDTEDIVNDLAIQKVGHISTTKTKETELSSLQQSGAVQSERIYQNNPTIILKQYVDLNLLRPPE